MSHVGIAPDDPRRQDVRDLLEHHLAFCAATSPPESCHALDVEGLLDPGVTVYTLREDGRVLGVVALKELSPGHAEVKSMHTAADVRGRGVGRRLLDHVIAVAVTRGVERLSLETGSQPEFGAARGLYAAAGFRTCHPFGQYVPSQHSTFFTLTLPHED